MIHRLGIIPARGNSKGIPKKNIRPLNGKPLLEYTTTAAFESQIFDKIVLSTDSPEIAAVGKTLGIDVPFLRPAEIATDESPMLPVIQHALKYYEENHYVPEVVFLLQPTAPLRKPETLRKAAQLLQDHPYDSVVAVVRVPADYSPHYVMKITPDGYLDYFLPEGKSVGRRQDAPAAYARCGVVYAFKLSTLKKFGNIYGEKCFPLIIDEKEGVNVDTLDDLELAESYLKKGI